MSSILEGCKALRLEMVGIYWNLLTPVVLMAMILEFFKKSLDFGDILKRVIISLLLLWSFEYVAHVISVISDGIIEKMGGDEKLSFVLEQLQKNFSAEFPSMIQFRQMLLFAVSFFCYMVASLSFYLTEIISSFVYGVLYVVSPLAFLCFIPTSTQNIAKNVYRGIITVAVWRILWSIMANILFDVVRSPMNDWSNFFMAAMVNLCIGISMLLVPLFARSLLGDGLAGVASSAMAVGTVPAGMAARGLRKMAARPLRRVKGSIKKQIKRSFKREQNK